MHLPHLHLRDWPFSVVPKDEHCFFLADRVQVREDVAALFRHFTRKDTSTIHVLWAYYGAGKTHTLKFISHSCKTQYSRFIPVYVEFPKDTRSFLDLYIAFMERYETAILQETFLEVFTSPKKEEARRKLQQDFPDLFSAMSTLSQGRADQVATANYWLRGQNLPLKDLRAVNITTRLDNAEKALKVVTWIITLMLWANESTLSTPRLLWMIDEFQRISKCRRPVQDEINGCLQSIYNHCPSSFSLFLSFSGEPAKLMPQWLSKELADRIGLQKVIVLPPLNSEEAKQFIRDVIENFRNSSDSIPNPYFPFSEAAVVRIVDIVSQKAKLKPRTIMQACDAVLEEADQLIESHQMTLIESDFAANVLKDRSFVETEDQG